MQEQVLDELVYQFVMLVQMLLITMGGFRYSMLTLQIK